MSPPAICCGTSPSRVSTPPAKPEMRIFTPWKSAGVLIPLLLVRHDHGEGDARGVVDADMDELPAGAFTSGPCVALPPAVAGDAVADLVEAAELLDVDVDELAGVLAFVAPHRLGRLEVPEAAQAGALEDAADRSRRDPGGLGDVLAREALAAQRDHLIDDGRARRLSQALRA